MHQTCLFYHCVGGGGSDASQNVIKYCELERNTGNLFWQAPTQQMLMPYSINVYSYFIHITITSIILPLMRKMIEDERKRIGTFSLWSQQRKLYNHQKSQSFGYFILKQKILNPRWLLNSHHISGLCHCRYYGRTTTGSYKYQQNDKMTSSLYHLPVIREIYSVYV